jgi:hypothetical protein
VPNRRYAAGRRETALELLRPSVFENRSKVKRGQSNISAASLHRLVQKGPESPLQIGISPHLRERQEEMDLRARFSGGASHGFLQADEDAQQHPLKHLQRSALWLF